jgi:TM2 domain-containing membrane protein YozV
MKSKEAIQEEEERIRKLVRGLPDDKRLLFFQQVEKNLKDPDTYATLNYLFIAGLHHFYLGKWIRGSINLFIFLMGVALLFTGLAIIGVLLLIAITLVELKALFKSQIIIQDYNNNVMAAIYREVTQNQ